MMLHLLGEWVYVFVLPPFNTMKAVCYKLLASLFSVVCFIYLFIYLFIYIFNLIYCSRHSAGLTSLTSTILLLSLQRW